MQAVHKRQSRGRIYLVVILIAIVATSVGLYVYLSQPSGTPDFTIAAPAGVTIHAGQKATSIVNVTAINRFDATVHLTLSGSTGLTASVSPQDITGSGTATLTVSAVSNGSYTLTVTGTSGGLTHAVTPRVATPIYAILSTTYGNMTVELFQAQAPKTVANFVSLAQSGFYRNLVWHRIVRGFVIQTGDPNTRDGTTDRSTWGQGGSSQTVPLEIDSSLHNNVSYLGMARSSDPNSGSSQFYINLANNNSLDGQYTVFGKVTSSMGPANQIANSPTNSSNQPVPPPPPLPFLTNVTILS